MGRVIQAFITPHLQNAVVTQGDPRQFASTVLPSSIQQMECADNINGVTIAPQPSCHIKVNFRVTWCEHYRLKITNL